MTILKSKKMKSINPTTNEIIRDYPEHSAEEVKQIIQQVQTAWLSWKETTMEYRAKLFKNLASILRTKKEAYGRLMTLEMGKIIRESVAEVEKCANACDYYAEHADSLLKDQVLQTDASRTLVVFEPIGGSRSRVVSVGRYFPYARRVPGKSADSSSEYSTTITHCRTRDTASFGS